MDQLEGTLNSIMEEKEELISPASSASTKLGDTISIKSLGSMSEGKTCHIPESKTSGSLKDFCEEKEKPDINQVRKAFWSRKHRFVIPKSKNFARFMRKHTNSSDEKSSGNSNFLIFDVNSGKLNFHAISF